MTDASDAVLHLWRALAKRDWEALKTMVSHDWIFLDMPFGPTVAARGPVDIVKRLKNGLENENLANYANHDKLVLTNGVDVMYEHLEIFTLNRPGFAGGSGYWISTRGWSVPFVA